MLGNREKCGRKKGSSVPLLKELAIWVRSTKHSVFNGLIDNVRVTLVRVSYTDTESTRA